MNWWASFRADPEARVLADRHYNRQSVGAFNFTPPGRCIVLKTQPLDAFWVTSWPFACYVRHAWAGAWICSAFRNEGEHRSSDLIREAVAATRSQYGVPPEQGMVTFVDPGKVRRKRDPGRCFLRAGFRPCGVTVEQGLLAFQLLPADMPVATPARGTNMDLLALEYDAAAQSETPTGSQPQALLPPTRSSTTRQ